MLYLSAFVPLYFLILIKLVIDIINQNLTFNVLNTLIFILMIILISAGIIGLVWNMKFFDEPVKEIIILKKKSITAEHFLGYFSLFVLFALTFELEKISMFVIFVLILILIGIVYIKNDLFYINPFLNILGYNFYDITFKFKGDEKIRKAKFFYKGYLNIKQQSFKAKLSKENFNEILNKKES